jgi:chromate transport protein ChrA
MELKWILAIGLEAAFWIMLAAFLVLRYRYGIEGVTRLFVIGVAIDTAGLLGLAVWDFAKNGNVNTYTIFIGAIVIYALTVGKRDMKRLDSWMERKLAPRRARTVRGGPCPELD